MINFFWLSLLDIPEGRFKKHEYYNISNDLNKAY